jgi:hypothetical protein
MVSPLTAGVGRARVERPTPPRTNHPESLAHVTETPERTASVCASLAHRLGLNAEAMVLARRIPAQAKRPAWRRRGRGAGRTRRALHSSTARLHPELAELRRGPRGFEARPVSLRRPAAEVQNDTNPRRAGPRNPVRDGHPGFVTDQCCGQALVPPSTVRFAPLM